MSETIVASQTYEFIDGKCTHIASYRLPTGEQRTVWWEVSGPAERLPREPSNDDLALVSLLFLAMHRGENLHVAGKVSRSLLERAEEFVRIWSLWRPDLYQMVAVSADLEVDDRAVDLVRDGAAIAAFSGGVDAAATVWLHTQNLAGRASRSLFAGVLIQGFDIPLDNQRAFQATETACRQMLSDVAIPMMTLRTNWKDTVCVEWEMEFGLGVFACLKLWEDKVGSLLVGSCEDYSRLIVPWGSHPLPTTMLSSRDVRLVYDGGHYTRTQKVRILSDWRTGYDLLRVCWEGDVTGENCGKCEKCIRTKLNALVTGTPLPKSLGSLPPTPREVARIGPMNMAQKALYEEIIEEAQAAGFKDERILTAMRTAMRRAKPPIAKQARRWARAIKRRLYPL